MKRYRFPLLLFALVGSGCFWLVSLNFRIELPTADQPILFYCNQTRHDLKLVFTQAIKKAERSLHLVMYALTDPHLLRLFEKLACEGIATTLLYDPSATATPKGKGYFAYPVHLKGGLMHRKILLVDGEQIFLGSVNFTTQSLKMHDNLLVGLFHPELAGFLKECPAPSFNFTVGKQSGELWLLPDHEGEALGKIVELLDSAKQRIYLAMFTLTHPLLVEKLIQAKIRGVDVRIAIDYYTARGASLLALERLKEAGVPLYSSQGHELLHHKWAWIDKSTLIVGSANWTQAAFTHNEDCFIILRNLSFQQKKEIRKIWNIIEKESI